MLENEIIENYKKKILEQYNVTNMTFEEWLESIHNKSNAFDDICNSQTLHKKNCESMCTETKKNEAEYKHETKIKDEINTDNKPEYAYIESIRGKKRDSLNGEECKCCKKYFENNQKNIQNSSRHRSVHKKPKTPPKYYDIDF